MLTIETAKDYVRRYFQGCEGCRVVGFKADHVLVIQRLEPGVRSRLGISKKTALGRALASPRIGTFGWKPAPSTGNARR